MQLQLQQERSHAADRSMLVAVRPVRVVQMPFDEIVGVVIVRHGLVPASRPMSVARVVPGATVRRSAGRCVDG
jgi:hypothetical protein